MAEPTAIDIKFELMMEKMNHLSEKYIQHAEQDHENFSKIHAKMDKFIDRMDEAMLDSEKGLVVRVDRVENSQKRNSWVIKTAITSAFGSIAAHIANFFK